MYSSFSCLLNFIPFISQGYEDFLRHRADKEVNHREAIVIRDGKTQAIRSMEIQVGPLQEGKILVWLLLVLCRNTFSSIGYVTSVKSE